MKEAETYNLTLNGTRLLQKNYTFEATDKFYEELNASKNASSNKTADPLDALLGDLDVAAEAVLSQQ